MTTKHCRRFTLALALASLPVIAHAVEALFQQRFFTLSTDNSLLCATHQQQALPQQSLQQIIAFYEHDHPALRAQAVTVLTDHTHPEHTADLNDLRQRCRTSPEPDICLLQQYWDGDIDSALRSLALFYDTKTVIKHSDDYALPHFQPDQLQLFEKAIRKIPPHLRHSISNAKPVDHLQQVIAQHPSALQALILEAFPEDYHTSIWQDHSHPLTLVPGHGFRSRTVAQVFSGQNLILFTPSALDKGKDGNAYRDIGLEYLVDFRLPIVVHEIAHTIDNFHFWNGEDELYFFHSYRKLSNDQALTQLLAEARLALWPSKWFEAFEFLADVNDGRYDGTTQEKLAELVAQYILIPERLQISAPTAYNWLQQAVFTGISYQGYDSCPNPTTRPLSRWQHFTARVLSH